MHAGPAARTRGPLDGIPYTAKDSYCARGLTVAAGSPAFAELVAQRDAFVIERLRDAGAVLIRRTNMSPMANGGMQRGLYGRAESPYNAAYLTAAFGSGSSNGSGTRPRRRSAPSGWGGDMVIGPGPGVEQRAMCLHAVAWRHLDAGWLAVGTYDGCRCATHQDDGRPVRGSRRDRGRRSRCAWRFLAGAAVDCPATRE